MAAIDFGMDAWMKRYRSFAAGVVVMVSPVLLAFALTKVNLTQKEHGRVLPVIMLVVPGVTLIAVICPFIICSFSKFWRSQNGGPQSPHTVTKILAPISSTCLVVLACWIMSLIIYNKLVFPVTGALLGLCIIVIRSVMVCCGNDAQQRDGEYYSRLENTTEYLAGITALVFVGLGGLALEGQINRDKEIQQRLTVPMATSFYTCVVGVILMFMATIPPDISISILTFGFDIIMEFAVSLVMFFMMYAVMKLRALIVIVPGFLILLIHAFYIAISSDNAIVDEESGGSNNPGSSNNRGTNHEEKYEPASLELTKVTFVGFLAVSTRSISDGSVDRCTECFTHLAAAAIVSGLMGRILTHLKSDEKVKAAVNFASICTHFCIVIAAITFTIMAEKALP